MWFMYLSCIGSNYVMYAAIVVGMAIGMTLPLNSGFHHLMEYVHRERRQRYKLIFEFVVLSVAIAGIVYFNRIEVLLPFEFYISCERRSPDIFTSQQQ